MKIRNITGFLFAIFFIYSCEYKLHDNYINLEPPAEVADFDINISLDVESDGETIYLSGNDGIRFRINVPTEHRFLRCFFALDNKVIWMSQEQSGEFNIWGNNSSGRSSVLTCEIYVSSGTGSIADQLDAEYFYGTLSWPVEYIIEPSPSLTYKTNEEGFLVLSWNKPRIIESKFACYRVYNNGNECAVIKDINSTSYICESYFGENAYLSVVLDFEDGNKWNIGSLRLNSPEVDIVADYSIDDSVKLSWNNPFNSSVCISVKGVEMVSFTKNKSACIPRSVFGVNKEMVEFSFFSYNEEDRTANTSFAVSKLLNLSMGVRIAADDEYRVHMLGYNKLEDVLYTGLNGDATNWLLPDCRKHKVYAGGDDNYINRYALSMYDSKMAIQYSNSIVLFEGKDMASIKTISCYAFQYFAGPMTLTIEGKLICFTYDNGIKGLVYDVTTGVLESIFDIPGDDLDIINMQISSNSRYLLIPGKHISGLEIITIENYKVTKTEVLNIELNSWCFNPLKPDELFVSSNGKIFKYNCNDLSIDDVFDYPGMDVGNIDPKTGYLLLLDSSSSSVKIINPETKQLLYTLPVDYVWGVKLFGNSLVSIFGQVLNLDKYLNK